MKVAVMELMDDVRVVDIEPDKRGSYLHALQELVGGNIEAVDVLYGEQPLLWVNENGIAEGLLPNRAIYANERMETLGFLSMMDMETPVKKGDLYTIHFGTIVACSYDRDDEGQEIMRDIADDEIARLKLDFWNTCSAIEAVAESFIADRFFRGR